MQQNVCDLKAGEERAEDKEKNGGRQEELGRGGRKEGKGQPILMRNSGTQ